MMTDDFFLNQEGDTWKSMSRRDILEEHLVEVTSAKMFFYVEGTNTIAKTRMLQLVCNNALNYLVCLSSQTGQHFPGGLANKLVIF